MGILLMARDAFGIVAGNRCVVLRMLCSEHMFDVICCDRCHDSAEASRRRRMGDALALVLLGHVNALKFYFLYMFT